MWNMDEKGFVLRKANWAKVVCQRGHSTPIQQSDGSREFTTVLEAVFADGKTIAPFIIMEGKHHLAGKYIPGLRQSPKTRFACIPNGWTSYELAKRWLKDYFDPLTQPQKVFNIYFKMYN